MSRHMFWKSGNRKNILPVTEERDFEKNVKKLEILDESGRKLYKNVKLYMDSNTAVSKAARKMSQELLSSGIFHQDEELRLEVEHWDQANAKMELSINDLNNSCQKCLLEPIKKLNGIFPSVQAAVRKREQMLQEYIKCQQKVERYQERERTGPNIVKIETSKKALNAAREEFNHVNFPLAEDLPTLYTERISYIEPCLQALFKAQTTQASESFKALSELSPLTGSKDDYHDNILQRLSQVKALSITVDD